MRDAVGEDFNASKWDEEDAMLLEVEKGLARRMTSRPRSNCERRGYRERSTRLLTCRAHFNTFAVTI